MFVTHGMSHLAAAAAAAAVVVVVVETNNVICIGCLEFHPIYRRKF